MRYANFAVCFIVKDLLKCFETKDDLPTLSLGSPSDLSQDKLSFLTEICFQIHLEHDDLYHNTFFFGHKYASIRSSFW